MQDNHKIQIVYKRICDIRPYERNPRNNDKAVKSVSESIRQFGFLVPIVLDHNCIIVCGHTRYMAAIDLGLQEVPCVMADTLNEEQIKAFRLVDNKVGELSTWDISLLGEELQSIADISDIDMSVFGFEPIEQVEALDLDDDSQRGETKSVTKCTCPKCGFVFEV